MYECRYCSEKFTNKKSLELHKVKFQGTFDHLEKTEGDPSWMCQYCPFSSQMKRQIAKHEMKNHANLVKRKNKMKLKQKIQDEENVEPNVSKSTKVEKKIPENSEPIVNRRKRKYRDFYHACLLCKNILRSFEDYLNHYQKQHQVPIQEKQQCSQCSRSFRRRSHQLDHVIGKHTSYFPYSCSKCLRKFKYRTINKHNCHKENTEESESKKDSIKNQEDHQEQSLDVELNCCNQCKTKPTFKSSCDLFNHIILYHTNIPLQRMIDNIPEAYWHLIDMPKFTEDPPKNEKKLK